MHAHAMDRWCWRRRPLQACAVQGHMAKAACELCSVNATQCREEGLAALSGLQSVAVPSLPSMARAAAADRHAGQRGGLVPLFARYGTFLRPHTHPSSPACEQADAERGCGLAAGGQARPTGPSPAAGSLRKSPRAPGGGRGGHTTGTLAAAAARIATSRCPGQVSS